MMRALLAGYTVFFAVAMVLPTVRVWKMTGHNPLVLANDDSVEGIVGRMFKLLIAALAVYLVCGAVGLTEGIGRIVLPRPDLASAIGWTLIAVSIAWVVLAQFQMGRSWRVGIDHAVPTELVAKGLFRISRNPIFLGMIVQLIGLTLVQTDAVTLSILLAAFVLISVQIRIEEAHLTELHGQVYADYRARVRRWL